MSAPGRQPFAEEPETEAPEPRLRRTLMLVGAAHLLVIAVVFAFGLHKPAEQPQIVWTDGGLAGDSGNAADPPAAEAPEPPPEEPLPIPPEPVPAPPLPEPVLPPSELVVPAATPAPVTPRPTPRATPKPTPKPTPKASPATPKASPATPKATPKASPKPAASPRPPGSPKPAATPKKTGEGAATGEAAASPSPGKGAGTGKAAGASGAGKGSGTSGTGKGSGAPSDYGWYFSEIKDRFYSTWQQPTSIVRSSQKFFTRLKIKIGRDGKILGREIVTPSGNAVMDESVMTAAEKVTQIDSLPQGLGGDSFEIAIDFKLDQDQ